MIKNKEIRYRFSKCLNKNGSSEDRFWATFFKVMILLVLMLVDFLFTSIFSKTHIIYIYAFGYAITVTLVLTTLSSLRIHKEVKTKNLLVKVSLGMSYKEYIYGTSFVNGFIITILTTTSFLTLGVKTGEWATAFIYMFSVLSICFIFSSVYLMACIFMANANLMIAISVFVMGAIIFIVQNSDASNGFIHLFNMGRTTNIIVPFVDVVLLILSICVTLFATPRMNFINWFDDSIMVNGMHP